MLILHTSDCHLHAPLTSRLSGEKAGERRRELLSAFKRLTDEAERLGVGAFLIAGDLFDTEAVPNRVMTSVASIMANHKNISFFYLPGNHEKESFVPLSAGVLNLTVFDKPFQTVKLCDGVTISGRSEISPLQWEELSLDKNDFNIVMLHGDVGQKTAEHTVGLPDAAKAGVSYLALGHYHDYREMPLSQDAVAVYSGTPEGRGFDETGEKGYVLIDTDTKKHTFVPFAKRRVWDLPLDVSEIQNDNELLDAAEVCLRDVKRDDLVRLRLTGCHNMTYSPDSAWLSTNFHGSFYHFEVEDHSHLKIIPEEYRYDRSLKGEFIRRVLADESLDEETKEAVLKTGLCALTGGIV